MSKKTKTFTVKVQVVSADGKPVSTSTEVEMTGASVGEVLKTAGISSKKKDLLVNGQPATLDTHVGPNDVVQAKGEVTVQVAERPQGS